MREMVLKVADLGCGSADVIINYKSDKNLKGVELIFLMMPWKKQKNVFKIMIVRENKTFPRIYINLRFSSSVKDGCFNAIMVMHEFLRDGKNL